MTYVEVNKKNTSSSKSCRRNGFGYLVQLLLLTGLARAEEALRISEERQRAILESTRDYAIFTTGLNRHVQSWTTGAQTMLGYTEDNDTGPTN